MKRLLIAAAVLMMFTGCKKNTNPETPENIADTPVKLNAEVVNVMIKSGHSTGILTDGFLGFYMTTEGTDPTADIKYNADNQKMSYYEGKGWMADEGVSLLWKNATAKVNYVAYHPYMDTDNIADIVVPSDQNVNVFDLLYAKGETTGDASRDGIDLLLTHQMSKLTVIIRTGSEFDENMEYSKVVLKGLKNECSFDLAEGTWGDFAAEAGDVTMTRTDNTEYEAIVIPQTPTDFVVEITTLTDRIFRYEQAISLVQGTSYELKLLVGKDKVEIDGEGISVGDWTVVPGGDFRTE